MTRQPWNMLTGSSSSVGEAANRDELRVCLFSSSLSGLAFTWFISLPPNLVITWADLEKQFHKYFFFAVHEKKITDLVRL